MDDSKISKSSKNSPPTRKPLENSPVIMLFLSLLIGFFGGALAVRLYTQEVSTSNAGSSSSQQVVLKESQVIADVAAKVNPSVVSVSVETLSQNSFFFGSSVQQGAGTGIILTKDGLILTNKHVIPSGVQNVTVVTSDGTKYTDVKVIGRDPFNDIAFIKINNVSNLTPAKLGDSSNIRVGDKVLAIGNVLGKFSNTVTAGIISGISRPVVAGDGLSSESLQNLLQTDAAINPGNSGGPLVDINGEVIGLNTAEAGGAVNIGFAIPINDVKPDITSVENNNRLVKPYLGVRYVAVNSEVAKQFNLPVDYGAYIIPEADSNSTSPSVLQGSPADKAGLKEGDILLEINSTKIDDSHSLVSLIGRYQVGDTVTIKVRRGDKNIDVQVTLAEAPNSSQ